MRHTIFINFRGGIISPGELHSLMLACGEAGVEQVRFGLRQQLLIDTDPFGLGVLIRTLNALQIDFEADHNQTPNIVSSYPAEEVFIRNSWLSEGVYKDLFDMIDFSPRLKMNICEGSQSLTPIITGNLNWIAAEAPHYWHLIVRFPKTNITCEWDKVCYSNHIPAISRELEKIIFEHPDLFVDNDKASGKLLFALLKTDEYIVKKAPQAVALPRFNLPYYEGLNRYNDKYWLGIYRRNEWFPVEFLQKLCVLCLETKLGQLCCTSWKSLIIKGITERDKPRWNLLLEEFNINMRHAANELNFQVEDHCQEGLALKKYIVKHLSADDVRTFGICFGIKTRSKSEVFSSIQLKRRHLINVGKLRLLPVYDILCAKDFNPNERTGEIFAKGIFRASVPERLRRAVERYYGNRQQANVSSHVDLEATEADSQPDLPASWVYQCPECFSVYDEEAGESATGISPGTAFEALPTTYCCPLCESAKERFTPISRQALGLRVE